MGAMPEPSAPSTVPPDDASRCAAERPSPERAVLEPEDMRRRIAELGAAPERCPVCAAAGPRKRFHKAGKWFWTCAACELVFVHDIYPEFVEDTGHLEGTYRFDRVQPVQPKHVREFSRLMAEIEPYRSTNRLLEVGCGQGLMLAHARDTGWEACGLDVLPEVVRFARDARGLDVRCGELAGAGFARESFDVVYMSEVIEHIVDPVALMRDVHDVLRPGGVAILKTGNARSWAARLRGRSWAYYRFGGHLHIRFYGPASARALARAAGFASVRCTTRGFAFAESREIKGRWYRPFAQLAQGVISPLAGPLGQGHRLRMRFHKAGGDA